MNAAHGLKQRIAQPRSQGLLRFQDGGREKTLARHRGQTQEHAQCTRTRSPAAKISRAKISLKPMQNQCLRKK